MKVPVVWLREYLETPLNDEQLADALTMAGLEVEESTPGELGSVYHTKVTPNRGDWMSIIGVAREASAALDRPLRWNAPPLPDESNDTGRWAGVRLESPSLCPRYAAKVIRNVRHGASPAWMQKKLTDAGMRPVNVIVDITNYVMLELGQPLHAFDYDTLPDGKIVVRPAQPGEAITTLDGVTRKLTPEMLTICDQEKPVAIAGIMGGADTEVTSKTKHVFLESAHFDAGTVRRTAKALGLSTEASYRYERYVDPELVPVALERACELLADLAHGEVVLGRIDIYPRPIAPKTVSVRPARVNAILGTTLSEEAVAYNLRRLGLTVDASGEPFQVIVPTFRPDLVKEIDLIEEVGRMIGYQTLPETLPPARGVVGSDAPYGRFGDLLRSLLSGLGVQEALTHSLAATSPFDDPVMADKRITIRQALSAELSGLRTALVPNLLESLTRNLRRRETDVRLFEIGKVFTKGVSEGDYVETRHVAVVLTGRAVPRAWDVSHSPPVDFFMAKGLIENIAAQLHLPVVTFAPIQRPQMHSGRTASVTIAGKTLGYVAEVDPEAAKTVLDAPASTGRIAVFELDADALLSLVPDTLRYQHLPRYPSVARDVAVIVGTDVAYALIEDTARAAADPALLQDVTLQSIYTGDKVAAGKKSIAVRLAFRAADRTLTDAEVDAEIESVRTLLAQRAGATER